MCICTYIYIYVYVYVYIYIYTSSFQDTSMVDQAFFELGCRISRVQFACTWLQKS